MKDVKTWHMFIVLDGNNSEWFMSSDDEVKMEYGLMFNDTPSNRRAAIESIRKTLEMVLGVEDEAKDE